MSPYALPRFSLRFVPVFRRNLLVWRKLALASIVGNIADPLIILVAFGYGLGSLLDRVGGVPYIVYLAAGAMCMSSMMAASFESLYSAFSRMHVQHTWESLLNAPLELDDIIIAEWVWAGAKAMLAGFTIIAVVWALGIARTPTLPLAIPVVALAGLCFSAIGLCVNALARGYDFFTFYFTLVITPLTFISGVYFPMEQLPDWLAALARALPLAPAVDLVRPLVLGSLPVRPWPALMNLLAWTAGALYLATILTRRRYAR